MLEIGRGSKCSYTKCYVTLWKYFLEQFHFYPYFKQVLVSLKCWAYMVKNHHIPNNIYIR